MFLFYKKGITLYNVLLSLVVISILLIPIILYMPSALMATEQSKSVITALNLAQSEVELQLREDFGLVSSVNRTTSSVFGYDKQIDVYLINPDLKRIEVTIYYPVSYINFKTIEKSMTIMTYKSNR